MRTPQFIGHFPLYSAGDLQPRLRGIYPPGVHDQYFASISLDAPLADLSFSCIFQISLRTYSHTFHEVHAIHPFCGHDVERSSQSTVAITFQTLYLLASSSLSLLITLLPSFSLDTATYSSPSILYRDIVVIGGGGGSSGTCAAVALKDAGKTVAVFEARYILRAHTDT